MFEIESHPASSAFGKSNQSSPNLCLDNDSMSAEGSEASASITRRKLSCLGNVVPTFEPLKVCLDDDTSLEDGDEDIFNEDDFYFGDEDFQALLSREATIKRISTPVKSQVFPNQSMHVFLPSSQPSHNCVAQIKPSPPANLFDTNKDSLNHGCSSSSICSSLTDVTSIGCASSSTASLGNLTLHSQESSISHASISSKSKKNKTKRRVSLHGDVAVVPIPMRCEYPDLVRERLWSSATELYRNAARNSVEFAAEGWNWRTVADDEHMVLSTSGELIHPVHIRNSSGSQYQSPINASPQDVLGATTHTTESCVSINSIPTYD